MQLRYRIHSDKYDPLDYPQTLEETKERLRVQVEHTAQYASALAEDFQERAGQFDTDGLSDEEIEDEIDRMSQETKGEIASHIGAINEWLKAFLRNIARRQVGEGQGRPLMNCVKEAFHTAFKAAPSASASSVKRFDRDG
ncbi:hypothetical protein BDV30DRAFT_235875 [Aspergillus minisclerotigenes]|uniref:Uncharacterized protein n=1 Tax=Aspergillus minisclerotigenes TaxID=656917 RepID=A0A5N6JEU5_9EURO|nr:hypothetical protein BDV30DRAFT_235875 [Aspergillus minisclerotigenes]